MKTQLALVGLLMMTGVAGCGTGTIAFEAKNGGPPALTGKPSKTFDVECIDGFEGTARQAAAGGEAGAFSYGCRYEGKPMAWNILGVFHSSPGANDQWEQYRHDVVEKATSKGCPGVAVRWAAPRANAEGETIGAFCVAL